MTHLFWETAFDFFGVDLTAKERAEIRGVKACDSMPANRRTSTGKRAGSIGAGHRIDRRWDGIALTVPGYGDPHPECPTCQVLVDQVLEAGGRGPSDRFVMALGEPAPLEQPSRAALLEQWRVRDSDPLDVRVRHARYLIGSYWNLILDDPGSIAPPEYYKCKELADTKLPGEE